MTDAGNQFHYYRLIGDDRILWGGYDAVYHFGNRVDPALDQRDATQLPPGRALLTTFPQLEGIRFSHLRWRHRHHHAGHGDLGYAHDRRLGGSLATPGWAWPPAGSAPGSRSTWSTVRRRSGPRSMVRTRPFPFPPEPLRWAGVELTRRAISRADRRGGRRGPWLSLLDRFGIGFDS